MKAPRGPVLMVAIMALRIQIRRLEHSTLYQRDVEMLRKAEQWLDNLHTEYLNAKPKA